MNAIRPNAFARYGTVVTLSMLLVIGVFTWFIKYPETVPSRSRLTGTNAPKPIISKINTKVTDLRKSDGNSIIKGEIIACLETTADPDEIMAFSGFLDSIYEDLEQENYQGIEQLMGKKFNRLGELQGDYQTFMQAYIPFRDYVLGDYVSKRKGLLGKDLNIIQQSKTILNERRELNAKDLNLSQTTLEKNKKLLEEKLISEQEYRELTSQNISKQLSEPDLKSEYISNESQLNALQKEMVELENEVLKQKALFMQVTLALKSKVDEWKNTYLLVANESGRLAFSSFIQENQIVVAGKVIGYIIPENSTVYLETVVPQVGFGKIQEGQKVLLKFDAYPWQEFGMVTGEINYISSVPSDSGIYLAKVVLPEGLKTNYGKTIPFKEGLVAQSEIVTQDLRLAQSLYYSIIKQVRK